MFTDCPGEQDEGSNGQRPLVLTPLTGAEAAGVVFRDARADDFYPLFVERPDAGDGRAWTNLHPLLVSDLSHHDAHIAAAADLKTYWNLCSYRPRAIRKNGRFTWKKDYVRGVHGVFIDFDCGRLPGDPKSDAPGALLSQNEVFEGVNVLVEKQVLPPFQMWADGTRGCYGVLLFEEPENVFAAAEMWKTVRGFIHRRAKHLAADELARAITQPLKAPGACGVVQYYSTGRPRTSLAALIRWFDERPHHTDLVEAAPDEARMTVEQYERLQAASRRSSTDRVRRNASVVKRKMTWQQKVSSTKARIDDMCAYVKEYRRTGCSRRQFFLDLASAVKHYEFARDQDSQRAYTVALEFCSEVNALLDNPLSPERLKQQVYSADPDPKKGRSSEIIRLSMGITEEIAERLNFNALAPRSLKVERLVRRQEERAAKAAVREAKRQEKKEAKESAKAARKQEKEQARAKRSRHPGNTLKAEARKRRNQQIETMLRQGVATREITEATGAHRQQVARVRERLMAAGINLPQQRVMKHGRKQVTATPDARAGLSLASGQSVTGASFRGDVTCFAPA